MMRRGAAGMRGRGGNLMPAFVRPPFQRFSHPEVSGVELNVVENTFIKHKTVL